MPETASTGYVLRGFIHHHSKHPAEAVEAFEKVLQLDPMLEKITISRSVFWDHLALDLLAQGRTSEARRHLENALKPAEDGGLLELLGSAYHQEGELEQAERCWKRSVELSPANSDAWLGLGRLALGRRRPGEAIGYLLHAVELAPDAYEPHYLLSQAYRRLGNGAEADRHEALARTRRKP